MELFVGWLLTRACLWDLLLFILFFYVGNRIT